MRVTPALDTLASFTICNPANPDFIQTDPAMTFDGENYVVVWADEKLGTPNVFHTTVARVTPQGVVLDTGTFVTPSPAGSESRPNVASDGERSLVVWSRSSAGVFGRFVNANGQPEGEVVTFATGQSGGPNLAFGRENYLVVWFVGVYPSLELFGHLVSPGGSIIGDLITVATGPDCHRWADVVFDGTNYLVVWQTGDNETGQTLYGQFVATDGSLVGTRFRICDNTSLKRWWPAVAVSDSNFLVAWGQGTDSDVYANVDAVVTGIHETAEPVCRLQRPVPTLLASELRSLGKTTGAVYDATGRKTGTSSIKPGIYFVKTESRPPLKTIIVR